jgi:hypothetical protein
MDIWIIQGLGATDCPNWVVIKPNPAAGAPYSYTTILSKNKFFVNITNSVLVCISLN